MSEEVVEKKKHTGVKVLLVLLLMIGCLVLGYYLSNSGIVNINLGTDKEKVEKKNSTEKENCGTTDEEKVTVYATTDEKVHDLIETLISGLGCFNIEDFTNDKKVLASDISNDRAFVMSQWDFYYENVAEVSLEDYTKKVQSILGKDYQFDPTKISNNVLSCPAYLYDSNNKKFVKQDLGCGGTCGPRTTYRIVKAMDKDGVLDLYAKLIFVKSGEDGYYSDYSRINKISENYEDEPFEKGDMYHFTFKNEDGNYVFVSSEIAK